MPANTYRGKVLNFIELLKTQKLEIPIIQRDYAQGRKDKQELRNNFLKALLDSITLNKPIKLDFIYGSSEGEAFQPLDGQQRLTTLFLLHWYAATKDNELIGENKSILQKFSYETRITSRDFCSSLVNNEIQINGLDDKISDLIIDSNWFFLSWKNDPTIDSMLRTIDDIHKYFYNVENLWELLTNKPSKISFYYVELENIGLTDDLYIKMNARGKLLTPFENFKASFQKKIEEENWEINTNLKNGFALKIDTEWTDFFWRLYRKKDTIDNAFMRFISAIGMIKVSADRIISKTDERISVITNLQENPSNIKPEHFSNSSFEYLKTCFDIYSSLHTKNINLSLPYPMWRHKPKVSILNEIVFDDNLFSTLQLNSATYTQKVLFFAQTEYLIRNEVFDELKFQDWIRVVRNIVSRGDIDKDGNRPDIIRSPQSFDGVINLINELSEFCDDIYKNLSSIGALKSQFAKEQVEEEKNKAKIITTKPEYKKYIFEAEDNELLRGRIDFIFYCLNYDKNPDNFNIEDFNAYKDVLNKYFNSENSLTNDLRRALLTINISGSYDFYCYWWSHWHIENATKRRLFDKFRELEYYIYCEYREYFKELVISLTKSDLKEIIDNFVPDANFPNWKKRLIKEPELLDKKKKSNYIAISNDNLSCWLLKSKRPRDAEGSYLIK